MKSVAFCFDLDGTLTKKEILPEISRSLGIFEEINILTKITLEGLISFEHSFKLRVKLLSTVPISEVKKIISTIPIDPIIQQFVKENRRDCYIITGNLDVWINDFIQKNYGCNYYSSFAQFNGDQLLGIESILNKGQAVLELKKKHDVVVSVGDGMNDCYMLDLSDYAIAYGGTHNPVGSLIKSSNYVCYDPNPLIHILNSLKTYHEKQS